MASSAPLELSGGLHGVGVSAVNALSDWRKFEIRRRGTVYYQDRDTLMREDSR